MKKFFSEAAGLAGYSLTGAVSGLFFNLVILHSPLVNIFPYYTEHFIFRFFLYNRIYSQTGFAAAAVISSLIFGAYHMNMIQGIYAFIMGMIFCCFYYRDHRICVPCLMHSGANLAVWMLSDKVFF